MAFLTRIVGVCRTSYVAAFDVPVEDLMLDGVTIGRVVGKSCCMVSGTDLTVALAAPHD